jgi:high mobility group protein B2
MKNPKLKKYIFIYFYHNKMTTTGWNKLTTTLTMLLNEHVSKESQRKAVLEGWESHKTELSKNMNTETRRAKRKTDSKAPKKPKSAYILFCMDMRESVKEQNPNMKATEITSKLGDMWNKLSDDKKEKYAHQASADKERYSTAMETYTPPSNDETPAKKSKKERTGPKRALTAYMYFCQVMRDSVKNDNPEMKGVDVARELGRLWKELDDHEKVPYEKMANSDKERYEREKSGTTESVEPSSKNAPSSKTTKASSTPKTSSTKTSSTKTSSTKTSSTPKATSKSREMKPDKISKLLKHVRTPGYEVFESEIIEDVESENPRWDSTKVSREVMKRWEALSDEDREAYELEGENDSTSDDSDVDSDGELEQADD